MPGRQFVGTGYKYGMNGQEKDDEIAVGVYTAEFWEYDSRTGRRWNTDPIPKSHESPYACFANNPIFVVDINGDTGEPNKKDNSLNTTIYLVKGKSADGKEYEISDKQISDVKGYFENVGKIFNGKYNGKDVKTNVTVIFLNEAPKDLKPGENVFTLTTEGISNVNKDNTHGMINVMSATAKVIAHEWGHLFGLADRYIQSFSYSNDDHVIDFSEQSRNTIPIANIPDPDYNPYNNLYSSSTAGGEVTKQQYSILFGDKKENSYSGALVFRKGTANENDKKVMKVSENGNKLGTFSNISHYNSKLNGLEPIYALPNGETKKCEPFNCEHGSRNKKAVSSFYLMNK